MGSVIVYTLSKAFTKVVYNSAGHFMWNGSNFLTNCIFKLFNRLRTITVYLWLEVSPEKKNQVCQIILPDPVCVIYQLSVKGPQTTSNFYCICWNSTEFCLMLKWFFFSSEWPFFTGNVKKNIKENQTEPWVISTNMAKTWDHLNKNWSNYEKDKFF